ncbi:MAG: conserved membrane protein of unknown function [Promethearchaeota archaeon]|jgi:hypothetical protein|nr:MAG: conserved membrane protein of unknown function [Candidatus Lokiarchaeota archaeon]
MKEDQDQNIEPEFKLDIGTGVFAIIGFITSWINMVLIHDAQSANIHEQLKIFWYFTIIFTTIIPTIGIGLKNRLWGYGYILGFATAGIPFAIIEELFIGGYTFATTLFIFAILWIIFWKAWRSLKSIEMVSE